jgi:excinuclease ABC subunit B
MSSPLTQAPGLREMPLPAPALRAPFRVVSEFAPAGDQPQAIEALLGGLHDGERDQVLLGVTGSGKTFTAAHVIQALGRPTLRRSPPSSTPR